MDVIMLDSILIIGSAGSVGHDMVYQRRHYILLITSDFTQI